MNIMLSRLHDCLFKDLIVPFMILKFRKLTLSYNRVRHLVDWVIRRLYSIYFRPITRRRTMLLVSQIIVLF